MIPAPFVPLAAWKAAPSRTPTLMHVMPPLEGDPEAAEQGDKWSYSNGCDGGQEGGIEEIKVTRINDRPRCNHLPQLLSLVTNSYYSSKLTHTVPYYDYRQILRPQRRSTSPRGPAETARGAMRLAAVPEYRQYR